MTFKLPIRPNFVGTARCVYALRPCANPSKFRPQVGLDIGMAVGSDIMTAGMSVRVAKAGARQNLQICMVVTRAWLLEIAPGIDRS